MACKKKTESKKIEYKVYDGKELRAMRRNKNYSQQLFWESVGVTQSGGSRYEHGYPMPEATSILIEMAYELNIPIATHAERQWLSSLVHDARKKAQEKAVKEAAC